ILLFGGAAFLIGHLAGGSDSTPHMRLSVTAPPHTTIQGGAAISPNGRLLAFTGTDSTGTARLWLRSLASLATQPIEGTERVDGTPFWSPDSRQLAWFADQKLKKMSISGGPPEVLCSAADSRGASWGKNGDIVFAPVAIGPLCRISSEGGV